MPIPTQPIIPESITGSQYGEYKMPGGDWMSGQIPAGAERKPVPEPIGKEAKVVSSRKTREVAEEDQVKLKGMLDTIEEKMKSLKESIAGGITPEEPKEEFTPEEKDELGIGEEPSEIQTQLDQLQNEVETYDSDITAIETELDEWQVRADAATASLIANIKKKYEARRTEMRDINKRAEASLTTWGLRTGSTRYAGTIMTGIISAEERAGVARLSSLDAEEALLISEAQNAKEERNFDVLHSKMASIEKKRNEKVKALNDLTKAVMEKNEEIYQQKAKISRQGSIAGLISQGVTDPFLLFDYLNYDDKNNLIGDITMPEIDEVLKMMPEEDEHIKLIGGVPYQLITDENGNIAYKKISGVETKEDIETFGGMPYRAIKDKDGNVIGYEKIPGVVETEKEKAVLSDADLRKLARAGIPSDIAVKIQAALNQGFSLDNIRTSLADIYGKEEGFSYLDRFMETFKKGTSDDMASLIEALVGD